jgi:CheY-like chemotaxis protein
MAYCERVPLPVIVELTKDHSRHAAGQARETRWTNRPRFDGQPRDGASVHKPHVLLIEDDAAVRAAAHLLLKVAGYRVSIATCTVEAVEHARQHHDLEAVISDYHLGYTENGVEAIAAVRAVCGPGLRAVLMSGDTGLLLTDVERGPDTSIAHKPINADALLALLPTPTP